LQALDIAKSPDLERLYNEYSDYVDLKSTIRAVKRKITQVQNVLQLEELKNRQRVLRRLGFTSADDVLSEKARVACEISTGDELLLTEMIFSGAFNDLTPAQCAAVLVCFVFDEKVRILIVFWERLDQVQLLTIFQLVLQSETKPKLPNEVQAAFRTLREQAKTIAQISVESRLPIVPDEYVNSFKPELSEAVFRWCNGASFAELCKMCDVFEGSCRVR
jgi:ATP-dependent RNA helicase DOB1